MNFDLMKMTMQNFGYKKIFEAGEPFRHDPKDLEELAKSMLTRPPSEVIPDSNIPAGYTYLGQFIDHDITSDSKSDRSNPLHQPFGEIDIKEIRNQRSPFFDLDSIYGYPIPHNEGESARGLLMEENSLSRLRLGKTVPEGLGGDIKLKTVYPNDLPREKGSLRAVIVDKRNDSHLLIAQIQVALIKFHNAIVKYHGNVSSKEMFDLAREITIRHYQHIVLTDFLPRIVKKSVLNDVLKEVSDSQNNFYLATPDDMYMPLEFSVAAYRTGHSMIRNSYNFNRKFNQDRAFIGELLKLTGGGGGLSGRGGLPSIWTVNWNLFFDIGNSKALPEFNVAKKMDTKLSSFLEDLLKTPFHKINSLAALDLMRGRALGLPTGEVVAKIITEKTKAKVPDPDLIVSKVPENLRSEFKDKTPLWFYLLAEAEIEADADQVIDTLGEIGSRIVAESIVKLIKETTPSIFDKDEDEKFFIPEKLASDKNPIPANERKFTMPEMLKFIRSQNKDFDELDPIG